VVALFAGFLVFFGRVVAEFGIAKTQTQSSYIADVESRLGPHEAVLAPWPNLAPFRPSPTFHVFAIGGIWTTLSVEDLQDEYINAIKEGKTKIVLMRPIDVDERMPRFASYVRTHGICTRKDKINLRMVEMYSFK
jgi:hypothetical protein